MRKLSRPQQLKNLDPQIQRVFNILFDATKDADLVDIAQGYIITGTFTETRNLNVTSPTTANLAAVLATLILDFQRGGPNRTT
jgi:hypothetical protein